MRRDHLGRCQRETCGKTNKRTGFNDLTLNLPSCGNSRKTKPMLERLEFRHLGPSPALQLRLGERLNLLTGDNGLGKTFVLDAAWWALTRTWPEGRALQP